MKMRIRAGAAVVAAVFVTSAAFAQTTMTPDGQTQPDAMSQPEPMSPPPGETTTLPPAAETAPAPAPEAMEQDAMSSPSMQMRDGKWYNGDRPATKAEIAAYKKAEKSKPRD